MSVGPVDGADGGAGQVAEKTALLNILERRRQFLLATATGLTEEQARSAPTTSSLSIGGMVKHCTFVEAQWIDFAVRGAVAFEQPGWEQIEEDPGAAIATGETESEPTARGADWDGSAAPDWSAVWDAQNALGPQETLADAVGRLLDQGSRTAELVHGLDLDAAHPLPQAPWFEAGAIWSGRDAVLHIIAELAHHSGHADIIRETIDGTKIMG